MTPPVAVTAVTVALEEAPIALLTEIDAEVLLVPAAVCAVTTATTPLLMVLEFMPLTTQLTVPVPEAQVRVLLADVTAAPAATLNEVMLLVG